MNKSRAAILILAIAVAATLAFAQNQKSTVIGTVHDISLAGCFSCHAPHSGSTATGLADTTANQGTGRILLWDRGFTSVTFGTYDSPTMNSAAAEVGTTTPAATEPRLYHGVEVKNIVLLAVRHEVDRRDVYRKVQKEVALADVTVEHRLVIVFEERFYFERYTFFLGDGLARVVGGDDADIFSINADVAEYQRQHALPDASKSNDE